MPAIRNKLHLVKPYAKGRRHPIPEPKPVWPEEEKLPKVDILTMHEVEHEGHRYQFVRDVRGRWQWRRLGQFGWKRLRDDSPEVANAEARLVEIDKGVRLWAERIGWPV